MKDYYLLLSCLLVILLAGCGTGGSSVAPMQSASSTVGSRSAADAELDVELSSIEIEQWISDAGDGCIRLRGVAAEVDESDLCTTFSEPIFQAAAVSRRELGKSLEFLIVSPQWSVVSVESRLGDAAFQQDGIAVVLLVPADPAQLIRYTVTLRSATAEVVSCELEGSQARCTGR